MTIERTKNFFLETDVVAAQIDALYSFGRSYFYSERIKEVIGDMQEPHKCFWLHTRFVHINMAVIEWCNVLGNDCRSKIHWHNAAPRQGISTDGTKVNNGQFKSTVRAALRDPYGWSNSDLISYVKNVVRFRNTYSAHRDIGQFGELPFLDKAYKLANVYLTWLVLEIPWSGNPQQTLLEKKASFLAEINEALS